MSQSIPKTVKQWNVVGKDGFDSLKLSEQPLADLGDNQVLVKRKFTQNTIPIGREPADLSDSSRRILECASMPPVS